MVTKSSISTKLSYLNAKRLIDSVSNQSSNLYVGIGRSQPWGNDALPPDTDNSLDSEYDAWRDMTAMKRVISQDMVLGFRRVDWTTGTVYAEYDDAIDLTELDFYVYTNEKKVYKCISNNNGSQSTSKPTHVTSGINTTLDGYKWKFMFTVSDSLIRKFFVTGILPMNNDEFIESESIRGSVDHLKLISGGGGYPLNTSIDDDTDLPIFIKGDGNEVSTARCTIVTSGGVVSSALVTDSGTGYPSAPEINIPVMIRQVSASGAVETAFGTATTGAVGQILTVQIILGGTGYTDGPAIIVLSSCYGYAETNENGIITNIDVSTGRSGSGFAIAKAVVIANSITSAVIRPIISPFRGHGASPERELYARYALMNLNFAYNEGQDDFTVQNDFRRIVLLDSPFIYGTSTLATARTLNAKNTLVISDISGTFDEDDIIYGQTSGAIGLNVDLINGNKIRYIRDETLTNNIDFQIESISSESGATATITQILNPEVQPYSGDILFINNRTPIDRTSEQIETITLVLEY